MTATDNGGYVMGGKKEENWGRYLGFSIFFRKRFVFVFDKRLIGYSWVCQRFHVVFTI